MKNQLQHYRYLSVRALLLAAIAVLPLASGLAAPATRSTDQIIVKAKPGRDLAALHARGRGQLKKKIRTGEAALEIVKLRPGVAVADALTHYRSHPDVEYAEPDYVLSANAVPNDPRYIDGTLWALNNIGRGQYHRGRPGYRRALHP